MCLICKNGEKISAHGAVLLRHCPQLRMIAAKFTCCYCHGTDCGGCAKNDSLMCLSVPDFTKETVLAFLELIYTGRTFFQVSFTSKCMRINYVALLPKIFLFFL